MKKLLIATTALVATAGMASADITISGHAAAGIYSHLSNKDATAAYIGRPGAVATHSDATQASATAAIVAVSSVVAAVPATSGAETTASQLMALKNAVRAAEAALAAADYRAWCYQ